MRQYVNAVLYWVSLNLKNSTAFRISIFQVCGRYYEGPWERGPDEKSPIEDYAVGNYQVSKGF